ncbi:hypothetical protein TELCIR_13486 [Teladorsagia circumcincta]|uniref:Uncharacterized protein n=1 Tax=Teladorsagia circumcincta TaxID=45464 RepID=A0A2G9U3M5_TELCI|nr:hypothetical protein TELCIR_13486 [Teladorsagia circumcincta]
MIVDLMHTATGAGYCDCGDKDAWKSGYAYMKRTIDLSCYCFLSMHLFQSSSCSLKPVFENGQTSVPAPAAPAAPSAVQPPSAAR